MNVKIKKEVEVSVSELHVKAGVRYWEDSEVNGESDEEGTLIPCRVGDYWEPIINLETGKIRNWAQGVTANIHYKVCDDGEYFLKDLDGKTVLSYDGYVPDCLCPKDSGYGDYIIMDISESGQIMDWQFTQKHLEEFTERD
jgi:hypothetical protein